MITEKWACKRCGSTELLQEAYVPINYPSDVRILSDSCICDACGTDWGKVRVIVVC